MPGFTSRTVLLAGLLVVALHPSRSGAVDLLGLYAGGSVGQSSVNADAGGFNSNPFDHNHVGFKLTAGVRPISLLGAEVSYIDFGHPSGNFGNTPGDVSLRGAAAFGMIYLPVPIIDVYGKLGLARLQSTASGADNGGCGPACQPGLFRLDRTDTRLAAGVGAQYKFGKLALRAEYERYDAAGGNPTLLSVGLNWTFF